MHKTYNDSFFKKLKYVHMYVTHFPQIAVACWAGMMGLKVTDHGAISIYLVFIISANPNSSTLIFAQPKSMLPYLPSNTTLPPFPQISTLN